MYFQNPCPFVRNKLFSASFMDVHTEEFYGDHKNTLQKYILYLKYNNNKSFTYLQLTKEKLYMEIISLILPKMYKI